MLQVEPVGAHSMPLPDQLRLPRSAWRVGGHTGGQKALGTQLARALAAELGALRSSPIIMLNAVLELQF